VPSPSRPFPSRATRPARARPAKPPEVLEGLDADARAARALLDDLAALVEAGLVAPVREGAAIRFALVDDEIEQRARR
jgi:hypothetical protein